MREKVISAIEREKLIVIVRGVEAGKLIPLAEAVYEGGVRLLEVTYSADKKVSDEETAENIKRLAEHFENKMYIGAGTVLTEEQVELTKKAGGKFIISPDAYENVIRKTRELDMVSIPGALTATEIHTAHRAGADFIKLFPITNLGTDYIKALCTPLSHIKFLVVGGVTKGSVPDYLSAGVKGFGISSGIIDMKKLAENDYTAITDLARKFTDVLKG